MSDKEKDKDNLPPKPPLSPPAPPPRTVVEAPKQARKIMKGTKEFEHHLFKLKVATMKRNISWKFKEPMIREIEHCHWYHSLDDRTFQPEHRSQAVGGHYHEMSYDFGKPDANGNPTVVCGPPMRLDTKKLPGGRTIQKPGPVVYEAVNEAGEEVKIVDSHTHEISYEGTEVLTQIGLSEARNMERAKVSSTMERNAPATQPGRSQELDASAAAVRPFVQE